MSCCGVTHTLLAYLHAWFTHARAMCLCHAGPCHANIASCLLAPLQMAMWDRRSISPNPNNPTNNILHSDKAAQLFRSLDVDSKGYLNRDEMLMALAEMAVLHNLSEDDLSELTACTYEPAPSSSAHHGAAIHS